MAFFPGFLKSQLLYTPPYPTQSYATRTIIITGANSGLGLEAAQHFVRLNAVKVILACRNITKASAAKSSIETSTGRTDVVEIWDLNLSSYASIVAFAERCKGLG